MNDAFRLGLHRLHPSGYLTIITPTGDIRHFPTQAGPVIVLSDKFG